VNATRKEKLETYTDTPLQIITKNATEDPVADDYIEVALEKKKKEANRPLYFKRV
jgi:hypothetical protein